MTTRHRKFTASSRSWGGAFTRQELTAFLAGEPVACKSSNVAAARWDAAGEVLTLQFNDGSQYTYSPVDRDLAEAFSHAPSKGGFVHDHWPRGSPGYTRVLGS